MAVILKGEYIPMRKNLAKLIALMMALVLVFSFAACGGDKDEQPSDTTNEVVNTEDAVTPDETGDTAASDETGDTAASGETDNTAAPGETGKTDTDTPSTGGVTVPATKEDAVKLYNDALKKVSSTSAKIDRKLTKTDSSVGDLNNLGPVSEKFAAGSGSINSKLSSLSASDVQNYSKSESGNNIVMTFTLKTVNGGAELAHGKGGYMYFLTMDEINTVVKDIGNSIQKGFKIEIRKDKSSISLQGGKLVVTVDKTTGKMSSAVLDFTEVIDGNCKALGFMTVDADLIGVGKVTYTLK